MVLYYYKFYLLAETHFGTQFKIKVRAFFRHLGNSYSDNHAKVTGEWIEINFNPRVVFPKNSYYLGIFLPFLRSVQLLSTIAKIDFNLWLGV